MSNISQGDQLTTTEVRLVNSLAALAVTPSGQAIVKSTTTTFSNNTPVAGGGSLIPTETPNGVTTVFTFPTATAKPSFMVSDNATMQATTKSGTVNWTWNSVLLQAIMTIPPSDDLVGIP